MKPRLLLHTCCAPCSGYLVSSLADNFEVTVYYNNPNIYPLEEYQARQKEVKDFFTKIGVEFVEAEYDHQQWQEVTKGLANEPEGGKRCVLCYHLRLKNSAHYAKNRNYDFFASTMSISPHKNSQILNNLGRALAKKIGIEFLAEDWKKKDRFKKAMEFSRAQGFYRQNY